MNTLYDLPGEVLRNRKELLRLRKYGPDWTLTHKSKGRVKTHSSREELETAVSDGKKMDLILRALGYSPSFRYEKFRAEWTDGKIEGPSRWIDAIAKKLGVDKKDYITTNYAGLFLHWKAQTESSAKEMTFKAIGSASMK
jgi:adenylate cyclase class 2